MPAKHDPYKSPSEKTIGLFGLLLFKKTPYSLTRLSRILECSKQTVLRMLEAIERSHYLQIDSWVSGRERFFQAAEPRTRPGVTLTPESIQQLLLCRDLVCHMLPHSLREDVFQTIQKTTTLLPDFEKRDEAFVSFAGALPRGAINYEPFAPIIETLFDAMRLGRVCDVTYRAPGRSAPKRYGIGPCRIISVHDALYVVARHIPNPGGEAHPNPITLAAHRFGSATLTSQTFEPFPEDAMPTQDAFGFRFEPPFAVKVRFSPEAADYVAERTWSRGQKITRRKTGHLDLSFTATSRLEVLSWVLSFGPEAELLQPADLRGRLAEMAARIQAQYQRAR